MGQLVTKYRWPVLTWFIIVFLPLGLFGLLADDVMRGRPFAFDVPILLAAHSLSNANIDFVMLAVTHFGYLWGVVPLDVVIGLCLLAYRRVRDTIFFALATGGAGLLNMLVKAIFRRERPALWPSIAPEQTFSFPSGHAMLSTSLVVALIVLLWPTRWRALAIGLGIPFALLVGASRIYLGVHYPSDVLGGWFASVAWVLGLSGIIYRRVGRP